MSNNKLSDTSWMPSLFVLLCIINGQFTHCLLTGLQVACKVALCNPHLRHTTSGRTPLDKWSARSRDLYPTTRNTHKNQTPMPQGTQTCHLSKRAAIDPCLWMYCHWYRPFWHLADAKYSSGLGFTVPQCDSLKCLFISWKSELGVQKTD